MNNVYKVLLLTQMEEQTMWTQKHWIELHSNLNISEQDCNCLHYTGETLGRVTNDSSRSRALMLEKRGRVKGTFGVTIKGIYV